MADHNPREHVGVHGVHTQDLKPEHKNRVLQHEASATPAAEQESDVHGIHSTENDSHHGEPIPLAKLRGPPTSQSSKGGQGPKPKPPGGGPKGAKPEIENQTEDDPESDSNKNSGHSHESHGGGEHTADKREGKLRGKAVPGSSKGGGTAPSGPPKGLKH